METKNMTEKTLKNNSNYNFILSYILYKYYIRYFHFPLKREIKYRKCHKDNISYISSYIRGYIR